MRNLLLFLGRWQGRAATFLMLLLAWTAFLWLSPVYSSIVCIPFVQACEFILVPLLGPGTQVHGLGGLPLERWIVECVAFGVVAAAVATLIASKVAEKLGRN